MEFQAVFKNMESSLRLASYAEEKLANCTAKYSARPTRVNLKFEVTDTQHIRAACHLFGPGGVSVQAECGDEMSPHACLDSLEQKIAAQLRKLKERRRSHRGPGVRAAAWEEAALESAAWDRDSEIEDSVDAAYVITADKVLYNHH